MEKGSMHQPPAAWCSSRGTPERPNELQHKGLEVASAEAMLSATTSTQGRAVALGLMLSKS